MSDDSQMVVDGNEAAASVAYRLSEVIAIYPITPASPMGELSDEWAADQCENVWGSVPSVIEMQSEAGAAGALHGALQAGSLCTSFTASQGLLLMIPDLYRIAGQLFPFVLHVAARAVATHALSIFGDHSDVMACRQIGCALLASASVQEAHDLALVAHLATLRSRVPFIHFFDGFRTSHELTRIATHADDTLRALVDRTLVAGHRQRALTPDHPVIRGTAQNADVFFQAREAVNRYYTMTPDIVAEAMAAVAKHGGRCYGLFDYAGDPHATRVIVVMGSGALTVRETVKALQARGEKVGVVTVRLYRPFDVARFVAALPRTTQRIAVLDRTKEPGAIGEPLYLDVVAALAEGWPGSMPLVTAGRYGLSSKEFSPAMVKAVFDDLAAVTPRRHFTVGINDDVTRLSLTVGESLDVLGPRVYQALFYGLGSDGTVGATKNTIKIVGQQTPRQVQGYFVYDSKKSGMATVSHLRFGEGTLDAPYLVEHADFVGCHQWELVDQMDPVEALRPGGTLLLNCPFSASEAWQHLPAELGQAILDKKLEVYVIDAFKVARESGLGRRINTVMQTCFFALAKVVDPDRAIAHIKATIEKSYGRKGPDIVARNLAAVDQAVAAMAPMTRPTRNVELDRRPPPVVPSAPDFVQRITARLIAGQGDRLPVSAFPVDGTWPTGTTQYEKRSLALEIPVWDPSICIQCNKCVMVCPHATVRAKVYEPALIERSPEGFKHMTWKGEPGKGQAYTVQIAPEDCTGCGLCVEVCPAKDKANPRHKALDMASQRELRAAERERYAFFLSLPEIDRTTTKADVKTSQLLQPLFEYPGACPGCGETPYLRLLTQLFGDRAMIANATGCSSIYGGNLPTTPYTTNREGRGPAWANSLFEDNAEFGLGMRLAIDAHATRAKLLLSRLAAVVGPALVAELLAADQMTEAGIGAQRERVVALRRKLEPVSGSADAVELLALADYLVKKSVWLVGGDGWAYDIGFGGLDHVLMSGHDVNALVLDTEVYSNTGGQSSKATPIGASAKFATAGKDVPKKDLGLIAMSYGSVYVARIAFGAKDVQTVRAFLEAEAYPGPSLIIAYSPCIAHGYDLAQNCNQQKATVEAGGWPLYRFDPRRMALGEPPLVLDSGPPTTTLRSYMSNETRFRMVERSHPERFTALVEAAEREAIRRREIYEQLARIKVSPEAAALAAKVEES